MESVIFRTGSGPINPSLLPGSPQLSIPLRHGSGLLPPELNTNRRRISRSVSAPHAIIRSKSISAGSLDEDVVGDIGSLKFAERCFDRMSRFPASRIAVEEARFRGGRDRDGFGSGGNNSNSNSNSNRNSNSNNNSNSNSNSNSNEQDKIGVHYRKMLKLNPNDPLLLRNYSKFLHEVEGDSVKAEEYYGRAILANPGDGELLSLYGKLIWDTQRDGERAKSYFDQAVVASPDDCVVMGSYAQFMWEAEEDKDEEEEFGSMVSVPTPEPLVAAF